MPLLLLVRFSITIVTVGLESLTLLAFYCQVETSSRHTFGACMCTPELAINKASRPPL